MNRIKKIVTLIVVAALAFGLVQAITSTAKAGEAGTTLTATVDINTHWTTTYNWSIDKSVTPSTLDMFIGDSKTATYIVQVTKDGGVGGAWVDGQICMTNGGAEPTENLAITAVLQDGYAPPNDFLATAVVDISGNPILDPAETGCYAYHVDIPITGGEFPQPHTGGTYKVTANITITNHSGNLGVPSGPSPNATTTFISLPTPVNETINVTDTNGGLGSTDDSKSWTYSKDFSCPTDTTLYQNGVYSFDHLNTAKITETGQSDDATVKVNCYAPVIDKTVAATYDEGKTWDVSKTVSPTSQSAFAGDTVDYEWTVVVTSVPFEKNYKVAGDITVVNPSPMEMTVALVDQLGGGTTAAITPGETCAYADSQLTIRANTTATCAYEAVPGDHSDTINKATATFKSIDFVAEKTFGWTPNVIASSVKLSDNQNPAFPLDLTEGGTWTYQESYTCSTDMALYDATTHKYNYPEKNTAVIKDGETELDSSSASTSVDCYVPTISKNANGAYDEVHDWLVYKSGPGTIKKFAGQTAAWNWTVRVDETTHGENYQVGGDIVVVNSNPEDALTVSLSDVLDDGSVASIGPCTGGTLVGNSLTVPAGATATCDYSVIPTGDLDAFAAALPAQVTENLAYPGPESYFMATLTGGNLSGTYEGWCVDVDHTISPNRNYTANVYSSYETLPAGLVEHPENFDLVNWIINYDFVGKPAGTGLGNYTYGDVQEAIWELIEDVVPAGEISHNDTRVNQIKTMAAAHEGFTPTCGDFIAVVLQPVDGSQPITIGQVTFASLGIDCAESNAVTAVLNEIKFPASADIVWTPNPINPTASLDDTQNPAWPITVSADQTFTYADPQGYACPTDPTAYAGDGIAPVYTDPNTATLTYTGGSKTASATATVYCYGPIVSKTAAAEWRKKYDWNITKMADPTSHTGFAGDDFTSAYDVFVDQTITDYGFKATGTIDIKNPYGSPGNMTVNVADMVSGDIPGTVDCDPATGGSQTSVVVAANTTKTCTYTASLPDTTSRVNTATGTFNNIGFPATANVTFGAPIIEGYPTVNVTDSIQGGLGSANEDKHFSYNRDFSCSEKAADYTNYSDSDTYVNTATIDETGAFNEASVKVDCYIPEISKTAAGTYGERHEWDVEKTVTPATQNAFAGAPLSYEWEVVVTEQVFEEGFAVAGTITVVNHNLEDAMTVALSDVLGASTPVMISECSGDPDLGDGLTIAAGGNSLCTYDAKLVGIEHLADAPINNTATAVLNSLSYNASDPVEWTATVTRGTATVTDDQIGLNQTITEGATFTGSEEFTCSTYASDYAGDGTTTFSESNTAIVTSGDVEEDRDIAIETINCYGPVISKDASGKYDEVHDWEVFKSVNTASQTAFAGVKKNFIWTVRVDETTHGENYSVSGKITVVNPAPMAMTISLSDVLNEGSVATIGPCTDAGVVWSDPNLTIPANTSATCDYSVTPKGDLNAFAAALPASVGMARIDFPESGDPAYFEAVYVTGGSALTGTYLGWSLDTDITMTSETVTGRIANVYSSYETLPPGNLGMEHPENLDLVNWIINQNFVGQSAAPSSGIYTYGDVQRAIWELIDNYADTDKLNGWDQTRVNQIKAAATADGEGFVPECSDYVAVILEPMIYEGGTLQRREVLTLAQVSFASLGATCAVSNTATADLNGVKFLTSAEIGWTVNKVNETATLDDDQIPGWPTSVSADTTFSYNDSHTCLSDPSAYTDGFYQHNESNTAVLTFQTGSDTAIASTAVKCYAPVVSKLAAGTYDERHEWDVTKTVSPVSQSAFMGDKVSYEWTVTVDESVVEENFFASGTISIKNPRPDDGSMIVKLSDVLSDGFVASITGCTGGTWNAVNQTVAVPPNTTAVCSYTADFTVNYTDHLKAPTNNTVTAEVMHGEPHLKTTASDAVEWSPNVIRGSATLNDEQNPAFGEGLSITDGGTWTYKEEYTCSTDKALYEGDNTYSFGESNTAILTSEGFTGSSSTSTNIDCYVPTISKDANGKYDEVHDWEVFKSVNTGSQTAFAGEKKNFTWTVRVDETTHGESYLVTGKITVVNPNPEDALTVELSDALNDGSVPTITGCTGGTWADPNLTVPAGGTATCDYTVEPKGDLAALAAGLPNAVTMSVQYPFSGGPAYFPVTTISGDGGLNGTYEGWCVDTDHTINQNTNYTANVYSSYEALPASLVEHPENFDLVNWIINQDFVGKDAGGSLGNYNYSDVQYAIWTLIDDQVSTSGLYYLNTTRAAQIVAAARASGEGFAPTCGDFVAVVLQPVGGTSQAITIAQVTFASLGVDCATSNAVTAVLNGVEFPASAEILWTVNKINETATLDDDQKLDWPTTISADTTFSYQDPQGYTCSTDPAAYTNGNGFYQYNESNTALLTFGTGYDEATAFTNVKCYAPVVTKTAAGAYDERHEWDVEKTVDPTTQNAFAGDEVSYEWTVTVKEDVFDENFVASGTITVKNPRPDDGNMTVKLTDLLSDGFAPTITGCTGGTWNMTNQTVAIPPNTTAVCSYTASLTYEDDADAPNLNTVTAELMAGTTHLTRTATANLNWNANVIRGSATLDDDQNTAFPLDISDGGTWRYSESYTCSTTRTDYGESSFWYKFGEDNTAIVTSGEKSDSSSVSTEVNCYWPQIDITKTGDELSKITDKVYYDITVSNNTLTDLGLRALSCTITDPKIGFNKTVELVSGAKDENLDIEFTIPQTDEDPFVNTASVTCSPLNSTFSVSDSAEWSTNLFQPAVEIIKTGPANAYIGETITYTFTINNLSSEDSPNLILDSLTDTVLGDLADDAQVQCDELAPGASCTFKVDYTPVAVQQGYSLKNVVTVHYHPADFPNDITDTDDHIITIVPGSQLTDTMYCPLLNNQFRVLYRLQIAPNTYLLNGTNPGQFYMNAFYYGEPGSSFEMTIQVPYPFMTQEGAGVPIQVHDGTGFTSSGCYSPNPMLSGYTITTPAMQPTSAAGNQIITPEDYTTKALGEFTTVTVSGVVPDTGLAYVTIHLDYGLKKTTEWKPSGGTMDNPATPGVTETLLDMWLKPYTAGAFTVHGYEVYHFSRTVGDDTADTYPASYNEIKKFAGFLGFITDPEGDPMAGVTVKIYDPRNNVIATLITDEDGYYMFPYKHTAKSATYTIKLPGYGMSTAILVKANGFAAVDFTIP